MKEFVTNQQKVRLPSRRRIWPFIVFAIVIEVLFSFLSDKITLGPHWLSIGVSVALLIAFAIALLVDHPTWIRRLYLLLIFILTMKLITSVVFLIAELFRTSPKGKSLFMDAGLLWVVNLLTFALWYWGVDQGGEQRRYDNEAKPSDLLFPQMTTQSLLWKTWTPTFTDYVFLSFNTSTAFSPTDTLFMSKKMKVLLMVQAAVSLLIVAVLAARAVGS